MLSFVFEEGWQMQSIGLQSHFPGMLCEAAPLGYLHANRAECHKAANPATEIPAAPAFVKRAGDVFHQ